MVKYFCDNCGKESKIERHISVTISTLVADKPNKSWPGNNVFALDLCKECFNPVCDEILLRFNKSSKDIK